jgi:hypothetical protein
VPVPSSIRQRRPAPAVLRLDISALLEQQLGGSLVPDLDHLETLAQSLRKRMDLCIKAKGGLDFALSFKLLFIKFGCCVVKLFQFEVA